MNSKKHAMILKQTINNRRGFTLVELMITVMLTGIAVIGIYKGYTSFSQTADAQEQMIEMQQILRIGMLRIEKDLKQAGAKEEDDTTTIAFTEDGVGCNANTIAMTSDIFGGATDGVDNDHDEAIDAADTDPPPFNEVFYGDGDTDDNGEIIEYSLDANGNLIRNDANAGTSASIISNVDALDFRYLDEDRLLLVPGAGGLTPAQLPDVRIVQACLLVHTTNEDYRYTDRTSYVNLQDQEIFNAVTDAAGDAKHLRRRVFCQEINIRNAGL